MHTFIDYFIFYHKANKVMNEFILFIFKQSIYQITTSYIRTVCIKTTRLGQKNKKMEIKCKKYRRMLKQ